MTYFTAGNSKIYEIQYGVRLKAPNKVTVK